MSVVTKIQRYFKTADVHCDAAKIGEFVHFLRGYSDQGLSAEIERKTSERRARVAELERAGTHDDKWRETDRTNEIERLNEYISTDTADLERRALPRWNIIVRVDRHERSIEATGNYEDVADVLDLEHARTISVRVGVPSGLPYFDLEINRIFGAKLQVECGDHAWLDDESPRIQARFRALGRPIWRHMPRMLLVAVALPLLILSFYFNSLQDDILRYLALGCVAIGCVLGFLSWVPALTIGSRPRSRVLKAVAWFAGVVTTAAIGAVVGKILFP